MIRKYGWKKQKLDHRDESYRWTLPPAPLASHIDLRPQGPTFPVQGQLGSCTGHGIAYALFFEMMRQNFLNPFLPSRLLIYFMERVIEGTVSLDAGAEIRDGIKAVAAQGCTPEQDWPYYISRFADTPPDQAFMNARTWLALMNKKIVYQPVTQDLNHLKSVMASGWPVVFGFNVFESFESDAVAQTGIVPMPGPNDAPAGGHCEAMAGYDDPTERFICANWWGEDWGDKGSNYLPYEYVTDPNLASDFWVIKMV